MTKPGVITSMAGSGTGLDDDGFVLVSDSDVKHPKEAHRVSGIAIAYFLG